jgi:hypothetical protein
MATLLVWLVWLQLMYSDYRRRRQPRMLIHVTEGSGPESHCLLVNLSQEIVHVQCVRAAMVAPHTEISLPLGTASLDLDTLGPAELENALRQGPLAQGQFMRLGSFEEILERLVGQRPREGKRWLDPSSVPDVEAIEVRVVAVYGRSDRSVGARRRFRVETKGGRVRVRPSGLYTEQLYSRRQRRVAEGWLEECIED